MGVKKLLPTGMMPARSWRVHAGMAPTERLKFEETDGSTSSRQKEHDFSVLVQEAYDLEVVEELSTLATQYWAEGVWTGK